MIDREAIAVGLGIAKCDHCGRFCPYCPRLLAARPDLAPPPPVERDPPLFTKGINFASAVVSHIAAGFPQADDAIAASRLESCRACTDYFDPATVSCRHVACGCNLELKVRWRDQKCPVGRW